MIFNFNKKISLKNILKNLILYHFFDKNLKLLIKI